MQAKAVVFLRRSGADGIGHVGWAFDNADRTFTTGSIENPRHSLRTDPHDMGFWVVRTHDPIIPMRERRYNEFKLIDLDECNLSAALRVVKWVSRQPYTVVGHNCMNATYDVLRAYGVAQLPVPAHHWEPNHWFDRVHGQHYQIDDNGVQIETHSQGTATRGPAQADVENLFSDDVRALEPLQPAWRTTNTPDWREFEAARAAVAHLPGTDGDHAWPVGKRLLNKIRQLLKLA